MAADRASDIRVGFISPLKESFVLEDLAYFQRHFTTLPVLGAGPAAVLRIMRVAFRADLLFCWFGSTYAVLATLLARMLGKPVVIQLGGADTVADPALGYGIWRSRWKRPLLRWMLRRASQVLVVHRSLVERLVGFVDVSQIAWMELPTGFDARCWQPSPQANRQGVLTVARCTSELRLRVKGIDLLLQAANQLPDVPFTLVGVERDLLQQLGWFLPPNVSLHPPVSRERLLRFYQAARVYCQPSRYEGLPNTVAEAMLCGCIPVVTRVGGMPDLVKGVGQEVPPDDVAALAQAIRQALAANPDAGRKARARVQAAYPRSQRDRALRALVKQLTAGEQNPLQQKSTTIQPKKKTDDVQDCK